MERPGSGRGAGSRARDRRVDRPGRAGDRRDDDIVREAPVNVRGPADLVLTNAKVVTVDEAFSLAEAVAVRDGRIMAVGQGSRIKEFIDGNEAVSGNLLSWSLLCPIVTRESSSGGRPGIAEEVGPALKSKISM